MAFSFPLFTCGDNFTLNCFGGRKDKDKGRVRHNQDISDLAENARKMDYGINIIPLDSDIFRPENLYPPWNHVELWNAFVIGNDKTYILASVRSLAVPEGMSEDVLNRVGSSVMDAQLVRFLDPIWDKTLKGSSLQFFVEIQLQKFIVQSFPLKRNARVLGAILFMYPFNFDDIITTAPALAEEVRRRSEDASGAIHNRHRSEWDEMLRRQNLENKRVQQVYQATHDDSRTMTKVPAC